MSSHHLTNSHVLTSHHQQACPHITPPTPVSHCGLALHPPLLFTHCTVRNTIQHCPQHYTALSSTLHCTFFTSTLQCPQHYNELSAHPHCSVHTTTLHCRQQHNELSAQPHCTVCTTALHYPQHYSAPASDTHWPRASVRLSSRQSPFITSGGSTVSLGASSAVILLDLNTAKLSHTPRLQAISAIHYRDLTPVRLYYRDLSPVRLHYRDLPLSSAVAASSAYVPVTTGCIAPAPIGPKRVIIWR